MKRIILWLLLCWLPLQAFATAGVHLSFQLHSTPPCHVNERVDAAAHSTHFMHTQLAHHHHTKPQTTTPEASTSEASLHDCCASKTAHQTADKTCSSNGCGLACQIHCAAASSIVSSIQSIPLQTFTPPALGGVLPYLTSINTPPPTEPPRA